jgi:hypothetical protein
VQAASAGTVFPPHPCHPNTHAMQDAQAVRERGDVKNLPDALRQRLVTLGARPHSTLPIQAYAEADQRSQLVQYYLLDTHGFEPNVFTKLFPGVNDEVQLTATGIDCGIATIGAVRQVVEPKPDLPTDPNDPRAFIDVFTDVHGLFVINNESGWYEGWMIHDLRVPEVAPPRTDGHAAFGTITSADARALAAMGDGQDRPGRVFTMDGRAPHLPDEQDRFPDRQTNVVPIQLSMGAFNCLQQGDCHNYWEFNYTTNWIHPLYELPFTGGVPGTYEAGRIGARSSLIPGGGPSARSNDPVLFGDDPNTIGPRGGPGPRMRTASRAKRKTTPRPTWEPTASARTVCDSSLAAWPTRSSSTPTNGWRRSSRRAIPAAPLRRLCGGSRARRSDRARRDFRGGRRHRHADDGFPDNARLFLPATAFDRFAVTREINDGMLRRASRPASALGDARQSRRRRSRGAGVDRARFGRSLGAAVAAAAGRRFFRASIQESCGVVRRRHEAGLRAAEQPIPVARDPSYKASRTSVASARRATQSATASRVRAAP